MVLGDQDSCLQENKTWSATYTPHTKINSKWIKDLNISCDTIKVLKENIGRKISDIACSNVCTNISPRARDIKERINNWDFIKLKSFFMAKENISKMKREATIWENVFANDTLDKGLISKIYKQLMTPLHKDKQSNYKWAKGLNRHFSKDIQRAQRYMKGCSAWRAIREMQVKTKY